MDDKRKDHADLKRRPKQLKTHNISTDDVENINGQKNRRATIH